MVCIPVIPADGRLRQENPNEFEANLNYMLRPCLKTKANQNSKREKRNDFGSYLLCNYPDKVQVEMEILYYKYKTSHLDQSPFSRASS